MLLTMIAGLIGGLVLGFNLNITYPSEYSFYITMALLAAMDSIVGAARSQLQGEYRNVIFFSGFVLNAAMAGALTYMGDLLGVPLYYAAIFVFGGRLFNNVAAIRRMVIDRYLTKKDKDIPK